jgi:hypothetical protein
MKVAIFRCYWPNAGGGKGRHADMWAEPGRSASRAAERGDLAENRVGTATLHDSD